MNPRNTRVLVFATALLTRPSVPVWSQPPSHRPQPKKAPPKGEVIVKERHPDRAASDPDQARRRRTTTTQRRPGNRPRRSRRTSATPETPGAAGDPARGSRPLRHAPDAAANPNAAKGYPARSRSASPSLRRRAGSRATPPSSRCRAPSAASGRRTTSRRSPSSSRTRASRTTRGCCSSRARRLCTRAWAPR